MIWINLVAIPLAAKICLVGMFPLSAYDKIAHWGEAMDQAKSGPLPFPGLLLVIGIAVEAITPLLIVAGLGDRAAALLLAGFCVVTALMYHQFWTFPRFWSRNGEGRAHLWDFLKNFGLVGGLLLVVIGGSYAPASEVATHPLSSGHGLPPQRPGRTEDALATPQAVRRGRGRPLVRGVCSEAVGLLSAKACRGGGRL